MRKNCGVVICNETQQLVSQLPEPSFRNAASSDEAVLAIAGQPFNPKGLNIELGGKSLDKEAIEKLCSSEHPKLVGYSISASTENARGSFFYVLSTEEDKVNLEDFKRMHLNAHFFVKKEGTISAVYLIEGSRDEWTKLKEASSITNKLDFTARRKYKITAGCYSINGLKPPVNIYKFATYFNADEAIKPRNFEPKEIELKLLNDKLMPSLLYHFSMAQRISGLKTYDYVFAVTISFIGAMISKVLKISSDDSTGLAPIMWCVCIGSPGTGKTPTQNAVFSLFNEFKLSQEAIEHNQCINETEKIAARVLATEMASDIKKEIQSNIPVDIDLVTQKHDKRKKFTERKRSKQHAGRVLVVTDTTSAGLVELLNGDLYSVIFQSDELGSTLKSLSHSNQAVLRAQLLQSESGNAEIKKARADRYSSVNSAAVAFISNIQPDILMGMVKESFANNDGFINRFQLSVYNTTTRDNYEMGLKYDVNEEMLSFLRSLTEYLTKISKQNKQVTFYLSEKASTRYRKFIESLTKFTSTNFSHPFYAAHISKYSGTILKIALVYQLFLNYESDDLDVGADCVVELKAMQYAANTIYYLNSHAKKAFKETSDIIHKEAESLLIKLLELQENVDFTASQIAQKNWRNINRDTDKVEQLLEYLLSYGLVTRKSDSKKVSWKVRPTAKYMIKS